MLLKTTISSAANQTLIIGPNLISINWLQQLMRIWFQLYMLGKYRGRLLTEIIRLAIRGLWRLREDFIQELFIDNGLP